MIGVPAEDESQRKASAMYFGLDAHGIMQDPETKSQS
jgi:hypothetical protein